jgi:hypothetical protein
MSLRGTDISISISSHFTVCAQDLCDGKMIPVETIPGMRRIRENVEGVSSSVIYLIYCKNMCKCCNVLPSSTMIKKKTYVTISLIL